MGSIYNKYVKLKENDDKYLYLFNSGNFYIFLDEDAIKVSRVTLLKLTNYSNGMLKKYPKIERNMIVRDIYNINYEINYKML